MAVVVYRSSDTGAPQLSGTVGSLVAVLDAVLVNGYGSQPAAGWTKPFSGTNGADYQQGAGSNGFYLHVDDNGPGVGTFKEARIRGYELMTAYGSGTNLFPTVAQLPAIGPVVRKSVTLDATARSWIIIADERTFYMFLICGDVAGLYNAWMFGEFYSFKADDPGRCMILGRYGENQSITGYDSLDTMNYMYSEAASATGCYIARDATGAVGSIIGGKIGNLALSTYSTSAGPLTGNLSFSHNNVVFAPMRVVHKVGGAHTIRGRMRGFWHFCHPVTSVANGMILYGTGNLAGKTFLMISQSANLGAYAMEISNTWDTN